MSTTIGYGDVKLEMIKSFNSLIRQKAAFQSSPRPVTEDRWFRDKYM